jgi:putative phage-type endonuclease
MAEFRGKFVSGSPEWHDLRRGSIGGSNVGAIVGVSPWESPLTRFYKMTGVVDDSVAENMAMRLGSLLEEGLIKNYEAEHPDVSVTFSPGIYSHSSHSYFHANPDALLQSDAGLGILEIKTSSEYWSEPPEHYVMQVRWYMWIMNADYGVIAGLMGGRWNEYLIERDLFAEEVMINSVKRFYENYKLNVAPDWDGSDSTYQTMRDLNRNVVDEQVELDEAGWELLEASWQFKDATERWNKARSVALSLLGDKKVGLYKGERICYRQKAGNGSPYLKMK